MRILNRTEFMKLPPYTFFMQCSEPWAWDDLRIKFDSLETDFVSMGFDWPEGAVDTDAYLDIVQRMLDEGISVPLDIDAASRDGCLNTMHSFWFTRKMTSLSFAT